MNIEDLKQGKVYYDHFTRKFSQVRFIDFVTNQAWISHSSYFEDSRTTISRVPVSFDYVKKNLAEINSVEEFGEYNGIGWKVKSVLQNA